MSRIWILRVVGAVSITVAAQVLLLRFVAHLCELPSESYFSGSYIGKGWWAPMGTRTFRGYPIAWDEQHQIVCGPVLMGDEFDEVRSKMEPVYGPIQPMGSNGLVPFLMCVLAVVVPPVLVWRLIRLYQCAMGISRPGKPRWVKLLNVVVLASVLGLTAALLDVLSLPGEERSGGIGFVPFQRDPGSRLWHIPEPVQLENGWTILPSRELHPWIKWLRRQRAELNPQPEPSVLVQWPDHDEIAQEWRTRNAYTGQASLVGIVLGAIVFRPWRKNRSPQISD